MDGDYLPVDLAANAASLGAVVFRAKDMNEFKQALKDAKKETRTSVIYIETDREKRVEGYGWWEVPVAQVSTLNSVKDSFKKMQNDKKKQKYHL